MKQSIDVVPDILAVGRWYPEQHRNDRGGEPGSEILYIVEAVPTPLSIEQTAQRVRISCSSSATRRG